MKPKLRFKEFSDDWEEKKLGEVTSNIKSYSISRDKEYESDLYYIHYGDIHKNIGYKNIITKRSLLPTIQLDNDKSYEYLKNGDIVIADASEDYKGIANALILQDIDNKNIVAGLHTIAYRPKINSLFLYYQLGTSHFKKYAYKVGTGMKVFGITKTNMQDYNFYLPSLLEQKKIGEFFSFLDQRIEKQERKVALLEEEKKGYMQQIFNQELRFKDEEGNNYPDWERKKLGEISEKIQRGASPRPITDEKWFDETSDIGWIRISDITRSGKYIYDVKQKLSEEGIAKSRYLEVNNLVLSIAATIGKPVINKIPVCIHDGFIVFKNIYPNNDIEFLYYLLIHLQKEWLKYQQPGSQANLNSDLVRDQKIQLPCLSEQEKIANFLGLLDQRIEKGKEMLNLMKKEKQGLMQKMFV